MFVGSHDMYWDYIYSQRYKAEDEEAERIKEEYSQIIRLNTEDTIINALADMCNEEWRVLCEDIYDYDLAYFVDKATEIRERRRTKDVKV